MIRMIAIAGAWFAAATFLACAPTVLAQTQPPPAAVAPPAGSSQTPSEQSGASKSGKGKMAPTPAQTSEAATVGAAYVIGPEDVLFIRVWQNPELTGGVAVGPDGTISLQLIGEIKASGMTQHQLEEDLTAKFKKFIKEPEVNVQILKVNSRTFLIQGDGVNRPGIYPLTRPLHVTEALLAGGGFTTFANKKKIYILRGTQRFAFNWVEVSKGKNLQQDILIQNGDRIYVN